VTILPIDPFARLHEEIHGVRFIVAPRLVDRWLRWHDFWAVPNPFTRTVYCLPEHIDDPIMRGHELVHFEQMDREGTLRWCIKYLWYAWRYGYASNPYEVAAYARFSY
jgi:hypothetical protein